MKNKSSVAALSWIISELNKRKIPFVIVGGLAANAYGATRALNDIDIDVPDKALPRLASELSAQLSFGPIRSVSECFDCQLVGFSYLGQEIELSGADSVLIKHFSGTDWLAWPTDLNALEIKEVLGLALPIMARDRLIAYKRITGRDTDLIDIAQLEQIY